MQTPCFQFQFRKKGVVDILCLVVRNKQEHESFS